MIRYGQERRLDLSSFLPGYVADEELSEVVGVFQDVLNEMYEGAEAYTKTREIGISRDSYLAGEDGSDVLYKYGNGQLPTAVDSLGNVTYGDEGEWPYKSNGVEIIPTQEQLTLRLPNGDINPEYIGPLPVGDKPFPEDENAWNPNNDNLENYPFDYTEPIDIQAVGGSANPGALAYNKKGMYEVDSSAAATADKNLVNFAEANEYLSSDLVERTYNESISVLEKIYKLGNLKDPSLIDFEYITYFADHIGYDMKLNLFHFENNVATMAKYNEMIDQIEADRTASGNYVALTDDEREAIYNMLVNEAASSPINDMVADEYDLDREILDEVKTQFIEMQVRALIENLPYWYKIKGTDDSLKILLYSFGLIADIHNYYTKDYEPNRQNWEVADVFYNTSKVKTNVNKVNALTEDFSNIPDDWYPTPHFSVKFDYNATWANSGKTGVLSNMEKFGSMVEAIHASKPINTVFKGLSGIFRTTHSQVIGIKEVIRTTYASTVFDNVLAIRDEFGVKIGETEVPVVLLTDPSTTIADRQLTDDENNNSMVTFIDDPYSTGALDTTIDLLGRRTHYIYSHLSF